MGRAPGGAGTERPSEWLALPGGRVRPVVSLASEDGEVELLP
jgi:hypothetical protein